jgi:hypothetical protein
VTIPRRGFVSGEMIAITAEIDNQSKSNIIASKAKLIQVWSRYYRPGLVFRQQFVKGVGG